jgi:predicted SAM-dependent methyltransferase
LRRELSRLANLDYVTGDLYSGDADVRLDVTAIDFPDESFDVILCSHVLEHVGDDRLAMTELGRVLKLDGWALINVPIDPGRVDIYEDDTIVDPKGRLEHFGQEDHVRVYSAAGFLQRLRDAGFDVEVDPLCFSRYETQRFVLAGDDGWDHSYLCTRSRA